MAGFARKLLFQNALLPLAGLLAMATPALSAPALAAPLTTDIQPGPAGSWQGFYAGYHLGGALGLATVDNPFGTSIYGDTVRTPGPLAGGQFGYNWQSGALLFGVEADASWAELDGTNTCFAYSGLYVSANCEARVNALGSFTGRFGWVLPSDPSVLLYGKAGLAWADREILAAPNAGVHLPTREDGVDWGWTVGGGIERVVTPRWTVKAEYGFSSFDGDFMAPRSDRQTRLGRRGHGAIAATPGAQTDVSHDIHQFKVGMNYRLGADREADSPAPLDGSTPPEGLRFTMGARYVYGWGQFHKDLGRRGHGLKSLASRLTYDNDDSHGGEVFARLDTPSGLLVKGFIGGGTSGGTLNDEDWLLGYPRSLIPYSNTLSTVDNDIRYGAVDAGYTVWQGERASVAPIIGYTRFQQDMTAFGCRQIADPRAACVPTIPKNVRVISEDDTWQALRLGVVADMALTRRFTLTGEAAYLPYVSFEGTDNHILRSLVSPEEGDGLGVQLEATLSYAITDAFSVGIGGRYWAMWTTSGTTNFGGTGTLVPMRYNAEQAHLLVQGSYKFGFGPSYRAALK